VRQVASLLLALALLPAAGSAKAAEPPQVQTLIEVKERPIAPPFMLEDVDGKQQSLAGLRGKVVVVNFWATWCPPCRREMPSLERLSHILKGENFAILAVNVAEDLDTVFSFTGTLDPIPTFPIVFDRDSQVLKSYPVRGLPTTFIVDTHGRLAYRAVGGREFDDPAIVARIRRLMKER